MKKLIAAALLLAASVTVLPAVPACISGDSHISAASRSPEDEAAAPALKVKNPKESFSPKPYKVLDTVSGQVIEVPVRDYVIGAVCAEMPASFEPEALKAQAVAAHTYAERQRMRRGDSSAAELNGADFSNDPSKYQGYYTKEQAREHLGDSFAESYQKIAAAVDEVLPYIITYDDTPIIAAFHSMSSGFTESAENAWGAPVEYLVEVDSRSDLTAPKFREEKRFTIDEMKTSLEAAFPDVTLSEDTDAWLVPQTISDAGTVLTASVGDRTVTGNDIRTALSLRSAAFDVRCECGEFVITTKGFGHGVGMSQYGANAMAADGRNWREILQHYYPSCTISEC
ncbi:MAG: stage II sporulation protein D [Ruminococcus sp.]|uniref:stage II sporulation protein D n=1 Tax=Ruminococcus sp. TaxID=41978 RepID=UPI0025CD3642|nr:stage II sporulation protein D [Ruminococcus sp.]MCR5600462.1 stage II sporulation protein D [Ruminococcus sp.]